MLRSRFIPLLVALPIAIGPMPSASAAHAAFPGSNGKIAFDTQNGEGSQIYTVNPDGSGEKRVTKPADGSALFPDWSPDGSRIVFSGDLTGSLELYMMNADGSGRVQLTNVGVDHLTPRFSPDGTKIAFSRCEPNCVIYTMNIDGTDPMQLTDARWNSFDAQWS